MQPAHLNPDATVTTFLRFQRWRRRQQLLWPGLFSDFLSTVASSDKPKASHSITLQSFRNVEYQLLIDYVPTVLCDGCGALQQLCSSHASSDRALPPSKEEEASLFLCCSACGFPTPLGQFRTLLSLPQCGPHLSPSLALAIFVEATGSHISLSNTHSNLHAWIRDQKCRMQGLHLLLGAIGVREEQLCPPQLSACDMNEQFSISVTERAKLHNAQRAERYLDAKFSPQTLPRLPFSISNLHQTNPSGDEGVVAAERAIQILKEASRMWKECQAHEHDKHRFFKLKNLSHDGQDSLPQTNYSITNFFGAVSIPKYATPFVQRTNDLVKQGQEGQRVSDECFPVGMSSEDILQKENHRLWNVAYFANSKWNYTNCAKSCAWSSFVFHGTRKAIFEKASVPKCSLNQEQSLLGAFAIDSPRDPTSYQTGKAKNETRVFVDSFFRQEELVQLPREECRHLRARRFRNGDTLVLFNSLGQTATAVYQNEAAVVLELKQSKRRCQSLSFVIAIPKIPSRADWLVEKLTELGAESIYFMRTKRTIVTAPSPNRLQRWKRMAISASKQSMRDSTPAVSVVDFEEAIEMASQHPLALLLCPKGKPLLTCSILADLERERSVLLLVGPEGGFEAEEIEELLKAGAIRTSLGRNRLRTETAAMTSAAVLSQLLFCSTV